MSRSGPGRPRTGFEPVAGVTVVAIVATTTPRPKAATGKPSSKSGENLPRKSAAGARRGPAKRPAAGSVTRRPAATKARQPVPAAAERHEEQGRGRGPPAADPPSAATDPTSPASPSSPPAWFVDWLCTAGWPGPPAGPLADGAGSAFGLGRYRPAGGPGRRRRADPVAAGPQGVRAAGRRARPHRGGGLRAAARVDGGAGLRCADVGAAGRGRPGRPGRGRVAAVGARRVGGGHGPAGGVGRRRAWSSGAPPSGPPAGTR